MDDQSPAKPWQSFYTDDNIQRQLAWEHSFLVLSSLLALLLALITWLYMNRGDLLQEYWTNLNYVPEVGPPKPVGGTAPSLWCLLTSPTTASSLAPYLICMLGGYLGGAVYSFRWLVKSVSEHTWTEDHRYWRYFTPLLSAIVALIFITAIDAGSTSSILNISMDRPSSVYTVGLIVGLFSDEALKSLRRIAETVFGNTPAST